MYIIYILDACKDCNYKDATDKMLTTTINSRVQKCLKPILPKRYRSIVQSFLVENESSSIHIATKWLWNREYDRHLTLNYKNASFSLIICAHFIYLE